MQLRADTLTFGYDPRWPVLRDVSVDVRPGAVTALFGPNGCGKSTLLRCLNGALRPQSGRVLLDGVPITAKTIAAVARDVAVVPQDSPGDLPYFTVAQMVMLGRYPHWEAWHQESAADREIVQTSLAQAGVAALTARLFHELSGGERQRVLVARALAQQGRVLLLDEPAAHQDIAHQLALYRLMRELAAAGQAVLMVCHDLFVAPSFADVAVLMADGGVLAAGGVEETLAPAHLQAAFDCTIQICRDRDGCSVHGLA